mgnify:CR=1 FL=1
MKVGDLGQFITASPMCHKGRVFFINKLLEGEGFEIILLDNGEK